MLFFHDNAQGCLGCFVKWGLFVGLTGLLSEMGLCSGEDYELVRVSGYWLSFSCSFVLDT